MLKKYIYTWLFYIKIKMQKKMHFSAFLRGGASWQDVSAMRQPPGTVWVPGATSWHLGLPGGTSWQVFVNFAHC